jgi:hypothetical protein
MPYLPTGSCLGSTLDLKQSRPCHQDSADVKIAQTYDEDAIGSLVSTLNELLASNANVDVLVAATIRNEDTFSYFLTVCGAYP